MSHRDLNVHDELRNAGVLGCIALLSNVASYLWFPEVPFAPALFFCLWGMGSRRLLPPAIIFAVAFFPALGIGMSPNGAVRGLCLLTAFYWQRTVAPGLPLHTIPSLVAAFAIYPMLILTGLTPMQALFISTTDVLTVLLAALTLSQPAIHHVLTGKIKQYNLESDLLYGLPALALSLVTITLVLSGAANDLLLSTKILPANGLSIMTLLVLVGTTLFSKWLGKRILQSSSTLQPNSLLNSTRAHTFSGLSSDFWRRHAEESDRNVQGDFSLQRSPSTVKALEGSDKLALVRPSEGICALSIDGTIRFINRAFRNVTEMSEAEPLGRKIEATGIRPEISELLMQLVERTLERGGKTVECKLHDLPKPLRFLEFTSQTPETFSGSSLADSPDTVIITVRDITERRALEGHLVDGQRLSSLGAMVQGFGHTLNDSLTTILGQASAARRSKDSGAINDALQKIECATERAGTSLRQILGYAAGNNSSPQTSDLTKWLREHKGLISGANRSNALVKFDVADSPLPVRCDLSLVLQAVLNLVLNSSEAFDGDGSDRRIDIELSSETIEEDISDFVTGARPGNYARLRVRDNGVGMTPETLSKAFDPLYTSKSKGGHTGLGLSIVYGAVRAHGGFLTTESHPAKGTTISLYLPLAGDVSESEESIRRDSPAADSTQSEPSHGRVLLVEDDQDVSEVLQTMLQVLGFQVSSATSAAEALEKGEEKFDLLLLDMAMPEMSGVKLKELLDQKRQEKTPSLVMTAHLMSPEEQHEDVMFLPKPFDIDALESAMKSTLRRRPEVGAAE